MTFDTTELKAELDMIDDLMKEGRLDKAKGDEWKQRIITDFEISKLPTGKPPAKPLNETTDLAHLPGRLVGWGIKLGGAILRGSGNTYVELSKREGYLDKDGKPPKKQPGQRAKSPDEMMDDLPEMFRNF
jgi:hypothetical protein